MKTQQWLVGGLLALVVFVGAGWLVTTLHHTDDPGHAHDKEHHDDNHSHNADKAPAPLVAKEPVRADGEFLVVTSFYPLAFALSEIAGDLATVINLGEGQDPHDFRPSTQDALRLQQADLVVLQGAGLEPWGEASEAELKAASTPVLIATEAITLHAAVHHHDDEHSEAAHHEDHDHGSDDPHTWLDPILFGETVAELTDALTTLDPENAATYTTNAAALQTQLAILHNEYETALANCDFREVIVSHDAFGYLAKRYTITTHAIAGLSTQDTPSIQTLAKLRAEVDEGEINAILLEESSVTAFGETLAAETNLQALPINPIDYLVPEGDDYFSLMRSNLITLKNALACNG